MEGTPFLCLAELLKEAALEQAAERTQSGVAASSGVESDVMPLETKEGAAEYVKEETDELKASYLDEKARNETLYRGLERVRIKEGSLQWQVLRIDIFILRNRM